MASQDPSVVLAHGAWADGSSWAKVITALAAEGVRALAVQRPISPACITVAMQRPLWKGRPAWYLLAEQDRMIVHETQRFMAERMKARVRSHSVDHTPLVTAPSVVVDIIREALDTVSGR